MVILSPILFIIFISLHLVPKHSDKVDLVLFLCLGSHVTILGRLGCVRIRPEPVASKLFIKRQHQVCISYLPISVIAFVLL